MDGTQSYDVAADSTCRLLLVSLLIYRIAYLTTAPVDLIHDEAYYWDWSRNLDWCYYSKPPGIAWLIALSTWLGGSTPFFVRLPAAILSVGTVAFSYLLGSRVYDRKVGLAVAALVAFSPANAAMGVVMTIDAPFLCCWSAALYCLWRMLERGTDRWQWAIMTMLSVGTGLLFKQTMIAFPALAGTFVLLHKSDRHEWRSISFWFAGLGSLLFLTPVVWWNSRNNWIMLGHTRAHFDGVPQSIIDRLYGCAEFVISQAGMISPLTYLCMSFVAFAGCLSWRKLEHKERFLLWFWIGPIMATLGLSLTQRVEANWPAPSRPRRDVSQKRNRPFHR